MRTGKLGQETPDRARRPVPAPASAAQLIEAAAVLERIAAGHFVGLPLRGEDAAPPDVELFEAPVELLDAEPLADAAIRSLEGLRGRTNPRMWLRWSI